MVGWYISGKSGCLFMSPVSTFRVGIVLRVRSTVAGPVVTHIGSTNSENAVRRYHLSPPYLPPFRGLWNAASSSMEPRAAPRVGYESTTPSNCGAAFHGSGGASRTSGAEGGASSGAAAPRAKVAHHCGCSGVSLRWTVAHRHACIWRGGCHGGTATWSAAAWRSTAR